MEPIERIEEGYYYKPKFTYDELYIALENRNFDWLKKDVERFDKLYKSGCSISELAKKLRRNHIEIFLLYLDRVDKHKIEPRFIIAEI